MLVLVLVLVLVAAAAAQPCRRVGSSRAKGTWAMQQPG